ncbi:DUF805 domain-containing protein [Allohahella marinimesophila]|uniref:DUF805 domain-containing protein n=1 Tax=Allohahella marinimesophila TaxID=1054972 RepID=A0ABP7PIJ7_9GAMM
MEWYKKALQNYVVFTGRAHRTEYWMFILIHILILLGIGLVERTLGLGNFLSGLYSLVLFIPLISAAVRRLHDTGRTGWWYLLMLIPVIGTIIIIIMLALDSEPGANEYGPNPKGLNPPD